LRDNPGGLLQEAVEVSDHFLEKNQLIVYHKGRRSPEKRYYVVKGDDGHPYPLVVLINRMTASAAEIVTGALQDHDRALVMSEPSFGKGLVQTVYPLSEDTGLALTTARYYTPSGRLIQRDYADVSLYDYYYQRPNGQIPHSSVRLTDGGREVFGGGGITPDIVIEKPKSNATQAALEEHSVFFNFGKFYLGVHKTIPNDFYVNDQVLEEFKNFLSRENLQISDLEFQANRGYITNHIREQLVGMTDGQDKAEQIIIETDPLVQSALDNLLHAQELVARAKKYVASERAR
jgi:carboxyl-terminal processing protease